MIKIAHRGNIDGSKPEYENNPKYIQDTLDIGFHVEIDVWHTPEGLFFGHDYPCYKADVKFLRNAKIWTHCKDATTLIELSKYPDINCFLQKGDEATITSSGNIWLHADTLTLFGYGQKTIVTWLDKDFIPNPLFGVLYGICSDYIKSYPNDDKIKLPFDVLLVDIDGVMTNGTKVYGTDGKVFSKSYCDLDFTAIKRFKATGIDVCFVSGDKIVNKEMAASRQIDFYYSPSSGKDKIDHLPELRVKYPNRRFAYVGDDYYDIAMMCSVDMSFCPNNSPAAVKRIATTVLPVRSGEGVIAAIYDVLEHVIPCVYPKDPKQ